MVKKEEKFYRFAPSAEDAPSLHDNPQIALMAICIVSQQRAGFRDYIDLRQASCPECGSAGFNTGWGFWQFVCGAEIMSDGEGMSDKSRCSNVGSGQ